MWGLFKTRVENLWCKLLPAPDLSVAAVPLKVRTWLCLRLFLFCCHNFITSPSTFASMDSFYSSLDVTAPPGVLEDALPLPMQSCSFCHIIPISHYIFHFKFPNKVSGNMKAFAELKNDTFANLERRRSLRKIALNKELKRTTDEGKRVTHEKEMHIEHDLRKP